MRYIQIYSWRIASNLIWQSLPSSHGIENEKVKRHWQAYINSKQLFAKNVLEMSVIDFQAAEDIITAMTSFHAVHVEEKKSLTVEEYLLLCTMNVGSA